MYNIMIEKNNISNVFKNVDNVKYSIIYKIIYIILTMDLKM